MTEEITVIIPVYNGERYITQAVNSVLQQTLLPKRVIVVDDGSTDQTEKKIAALAKKSPLPIIYVKKKHAGLSSARNAGVQIDDSFYLAFLDSDDMWHPEKLEKQLAVFRTSSLQNLGLVYCNYSFIDDEGKTITKPGNVGENANRYVLDSSIRGDIFPKQLMFNRIAGSGSAVLIKRSCFDALGLFDETLGAYEDMDMWLRISEMFSCDYAPQTLVYLRRHQKNMTSNSEYATLHEKIKLYNKWKHHPSVDFVVLRQWYDLLVTEWTASLLNPGIRSRITRSDIAGTVKLLLRNSPVAVGVAVPFFFRIMKGNIRKLWRRR